MAQALPTLPRITAHGLIRGGFGDRPGIVLVQLILQEDPVGPHGTGEGVVFPIAEGSRTITRAMGGEPEADGVAVDFNPHVATGVTCPPAQQDERVKLFKIASTFESIPVDVFEHFGKPAFLQDALSVFAYGQAPGLVCLSAQDEFRVFVLLLRSNHRFPNTLSARR